LRSVRDAPSFDIVPTLQAAGARIVAFDPEGMKEAAWLTPKAAFEDCRVRRGCTRGHHRMAGVAQPRSVAVQASDATVAHHRLATSSIPKNCAAWAFAYEGVGHRRQPAPTVSKLLDNNGKISTEDPISRFAEQ
jgi:UDPglucose 6-dehydrogenase